MGIFGHGSGPDTLPRWVDFAIPNAVAIGLLYWKWKNNSLTSQQLAIAGPILLLILNCVAAFLSRHKSKTNS